MCNMHLGDKNLVLQCPGVFRNTNKGKGEQVNSLRLEMIFSVSIYYSQEFRGEIDCYHHLELTAVMQTLK